MTDKQPKILQLSLSQGILVENDKDIVRGEFKALMDKLSTEVENGNINPQATFVYRDKEKMNYHFDVCDILPTEPYSSHWKVYYTPSLCSALDVLDGIESTLLYLIDRRTSEGPYKRPWWKLL